MRKLLFVCALLFNMNSSARTWTIDELRSEIKPKLIKEFGSKHVNNYWVRAIRIAWLESKFNDKALGRDNDTGILQITPIMVKEYNRLEKNQIYKLSDCYNVYNSFRIFMRVMKENKTLNESEMLANWNGGSNGKPTKSYNARYQKAKEDIKNMQK